MSFFAVRGGGKRRVVGGLDLHEPGVVHRAGGLLEVAKALRGQALKVRLLFAEHLEHLALLAAVDAQCRPALLPVREPGVLRFERIELAPLERGALGVLDGALDRALAIGIGHAARIGHDPVVREHRGVHRIQLRA